MEQILLAIISTLVKYGVPETVILGAVIVGCTWLLDRRIRKYFSERAQTNSSIHQDVLKLREDLKTSLERLHSLQQKLLQITEKQADITTDRHNHIIDLLHNIDKEISKIQGQLKVVEKMLDTFEV